MEYKASQTLRAEHKREKSPVKNYFLFDEKTVEFFLYGNKELRIIDVNKLKRKAAGYQESSSKNPKVTADCEEPRLTGAIRSFPDEVQLCVSSIPGASYGVCAKEHIPLGTWIGPYEGKRITSQQLTPQIDSEHLWEIFKDGNLSHFLDGSDEDDSSWMRFIRCARHTNEQNLYAFQYCGNIFYRAFKEIPPGRELLVWYDDKYPQFYGIPLGMQDYEFFRESASFARRPLKQAITSTQVSSSVDDDRKIKVFSESQEKSQKGNSRNSSTQPMQPRLVRPTLSMSNSFGREQLGSLAVTDGALHPESSREEIKRTGKNDQQTNVCFKPPVKTFSQRSFTSDIDLIQSEIRTNFTRSERSEKLLDKTYLPKKEASVLQRKESSCLNSKSLTPLTSNTTAVSSTQLTDDDQQISTRPMEGNASKSGESLERLMPALQPFLPPPLHTHINQLHYEPVGCHTSGTPIEDFGMWRCRQCFKTFTQRVSLQMHECSQPPEKPYQCGQCRLSFATPSELRSHVELHSNDKFFKCGFCSRTFSGATTLNNHIRTHTGEKPFLCEKCNRTFSQASHLARHQRVPGECV